MYLHCIRLLRIFDRFADFGVFFFNIQVLSTFVTCHGVVFLCTCICIVYIRYAF